MKFYFVLFCFFCSSVFGQSNLIDKHFFEGKVWASSSDHISFFKSDSVNLIQVKGFNSLDDSDSMNLSNYFQKDYTIISLQKRRNLVIWYFSISSWTITKVLGKYYWDFDDDLQILTLFKGNLVLRKFQVCKDLTKCDSVPSKFDLLDKVQTVHLTFKAITSL